MVQREDGPEEDQCASTRTVQMGKLAAVDLRCTLKRRQHETPIHLSSRDYGDVRMVARWSGEFEEPEP